jgi:REP element-mobilizing transposase RayT
MSEKYKFRDPEGIYFATSTMVHWIDLFTRKELKHIVVSSIKHCQEKKGLLVYAWVLMPSHLHMIVSSKGMPLSEIMRDFKKYTSRKIIKEINNINESRKDWLLRAFVKAGKDLKRATNNKVCKDGNHPIELGNNQLQQEKLDYIHQKPVEAEIVDEPENYWYSSARDYSGLRGLIEVELIN